MYRKMKSFHYGRVVMKDDLSAPLLYVFVKCFEGCKKINIAWTS